MPSTSSHLDILDLHPPEQNITEQVLAGLAKQQPTLPCMLFYDERGSQLFDDITALDEYYQTRTERQILKNALPDLDATLGRDLTLVEYGSGSSDKTRHLLEGLDVTTYVPIDISRWYLETAAERLREQFEALTIAPVLADYNQDLRLPDAAGENRAAFFPGSTLGNFSRPQAVQFLKRAADLLGEGGHLILGVDLKKDPAILHAAYSDAAGTTAPFNLNLLRRLNDELDADFYLDRWDHYAPLNLIDGRIEMHLVSAADQTVSVADISFEFERGQSIWTESSFKYTQRQITRLAGEAGFDVRQTWTDEKALFTVQLLVVRG